MTPATVSALWTKHRPVAYRVASEFRIPGHDPDDTRQEALIALWQAARTFDPGKGSFPAWAGRCVTARLTDLLRTATRMKRHSDTVELEDVAAPPDSDGPEQLRLAVAALPSLSEFERRSLARTLNGDPMTPQASRAANRARHKLRAEAHASQ